VKSVKSREAFEAALEDARMQYDNGQRLEARVNALDAALKFLRSIGFTLSQLRPRDDLAIHAMDEHILRLHGKRPGPKPKPIPQQLLWASSAAAVTILVSRGTETNKAIRTIAKGSGLDQKRLRTFRDNINRGCSHRVTKWMYDDKVAKWGASMSEEQMIGALQELRDYFC
jgi:hypothetical protein